jgi:predicted metal-dependent HD superfamily phosphohydrolase
MAVHDAPQWLIPAFVRSVQAVGGTAPTEEIETTARALLQRWSEPRRRFHNVRHLVGVITRVDELTEETHSPNLVRLAAWYHGTVFDSSPETLDQAHGGEDEQASADFAYDDLLGLGVPEVNAERVRRLIRRLDRHTPDPTNPDTAVLCDADLAMLAVEPQRYRAYLDDISAEYEHVPRREFLEARRRILVRLLARKALFVSPMSERWEEPARQNIAAELARITKELSKLDAAEPPAPATD